MLRYVSITKLTDIARCIKETKVVFIFSVIHYHLDKTNNGCEFTFSSFYKLKGNVLNVAFILYGVKCSRMFRALQHTSGKMKE